MEIRRIERHAGVLAILSATLLVALLILDTDVITASHQFHILESEPHVSASRTILVKLIPARPGDLVILHPQSHTHQSPYSAMELFVTEPGQADRYLAGHVPEPVHLYRDDLVVGGTDPTVRFVRPPGGDRLEVVWVLHRAPSTTPASTGELESEAYEATTFPVVMRGWGVTTHLILLVGMVAAGALALISSALWARRAWIHFELPFVMTEQNLRRVRRRLWLFLPLLVVAAWSFLGFFTATLWEFPGPSDAWSRPVEGLMMGVAAGALLAWAFLQWMVQRALRSA